MDEDTQRRVGVALLRTMDNFAKTTLCDSHSQTVEVGTLYAGLVLVGAGKIVPQASMRVTVDGQHFLVTATPVDAPIEA